MIAWEEGLEETPSGAAREIVQSSVWSSSAWVTADGTPWRRTYNPIVATWTWEPMPMAFDAEQTRLGIHLAAGWRSIETAVATAWLHREPGSWAHVRAFTPGDCHVDNLTWNEPELDAERFTPDAETWSPLRWECGIVPCDTTYQISSCARLRSPSGAVTRGFAALDARWAAVRGAGLVNLLAAAGLAANDVKVPPRMYQAYKSIVAGVHPSFHATRMRISLSSAWNSYQLAAPIVPDAHIYGKAIVSRDLWAALLGMQARRDARLGARLLELHPAVAQDLKREVAMEELRFARTCVLGSVWKPPN